MLRVSVAPCEARFRGLGRALGGAGMLALAGCMAVHAPIEHVNLSSRDPGSVDMTIVGGGASAAGAGVGGALVASDVHLKDGLSLTSAATVGGGQGAVMGGVTRFGARKRLREGVVSVGGGALAGGYTRFEHGPGVANVGLDVEVVAGKAWQRYELQFGVRPTVGGMFVSDAIGPYAVIPLGFNQAFRLGNSDLRPLFLTLGLFWQPAAYFGWRVDGSASMDFRSGGAQLGVTWRY